MDGPTFTPPSTPRGNINPAVINSSPLAFAIELKNQGYYCEAIDLLIPLIQKGNSHAQSEFKKVIDLIIPIAQNGNSYTESELKKLINHLIPLANVHGDPYTQLVIGLLTPLADIYGEPHAQLKLGHMYAEGLDVTQDYTKALEYYEKSLTASEDNRFLEKAAKYFSLIISRDEASVSERATAYELLGLLHYYNRKDVITAMRFINQGAVRGDAPCCLRLSTMYRKHYPETYGYFHWHSQFEKLQVSDEANNAIDASYCFRLARIYRDYPDLDKASYWLRKGDWLQGRR
jgi:TPR repeat protein